MIKLQQLEDVILFILEEEAGIYLDSTAETPQFTFKKDICDTSRELANKQKICDILNRKE